MKPTFEQVMEVYEDHGRPSCRQLEALLAERGFEISYRTLNRWIENGKEPGSKALAHTTKVQGVKREIAKALLGIPEQDKREADARAQNDIKQLPPAEPGKTAGRTAQDVVQDEATIIDARIKELMVMNPAQLDLAEEKARKMLNVVLAETAMRRAHVMALIPKETAALIEAFTEASKRTVDGGIEAPKKDDGKSIEGNMIDVTPKSQLAGAIDAFLEQEGMKG